MINIPDRGPTPSSLQDPRIREYLDQLASHEANPQTYSKPKPPTPYRSSDLIDAFEQYFFCKCYLTELWEVTAAVFEVDHFIPQNERPDLVYEWSNLFPIDHHTNKMRPKRTPTGGYLNPCDPGDDVENDILYEMDFDSLAVGFSAADPSKTKAVNSAELLDRLHNGHDETTRRVTLSLRKAIQDVYEELCREVNTWISEEESPNSRDRAAAKIRNILSRRSSFTMLLRSSDVVQAYVPQTWLD